MEVGGGPNLKYFQRVQPGHLASPLISPLFPWQGLIFYIRPARDDLVPGRQPTTTFVREPASQPMLSSCCSCYDMSPHDPDTRPDHTRRCSVRASGEAPEGWGRGGNGAMGCGL